MSRPSMPRWFVGKPAALATGLLAGTQMQFMVPNPAVLSVYAIRDASGGQDEEDDEVYRERIRNFGLINTTTGPQTQYESAAMNVTSEILDARALNLGAGVVGIYLLLASDTGAAAILDSVSAALNAQDVRPLTDTVEVYRATQMPYELKSAVCTGGGQQHHDGHWRGGGGIPEMAG